MPPETGVVESSVLAEEVDPVPEEEVDPVPEEEEDEAVVPEAVPPLVDESDELSEGGW